MDLVTNTWQTLCLPAKVYLVLAVVGIISVLVAPPPKHGRAPPKLASLISNVLWAAVWVWLIAMLCEAGWNKTAWVLAVGLPVLTLIVLVAFVLGLFLEKA